MGDRLDNISAVLGFPYSLFPPCSDVPLHLAISSSTNFLALSFMFSWVAAHMILKSVWTLSGTSTLIILVFSAISTFCVFISIITFWLLTYSSTLLTNYIKQLDTLGTFRYYCIYSTLEHPLVELQMELRRYPERALYPFLLELMDTIDPEIIPDGKRVRLLTNGDKKAVYKPVGQLAIELKRKPQTLREWAKLLLTYSPDFYQHFKPRTAYNPYVQEWLCRINNYDITEPSSAPRPQIIEDYVKSNAPIFTFENYLQELTNECQTESKIDNAIIIKAA